MGTFQKVISHSLPQRYVIEIFMVWQADGFISLILPDNIKFSSFITYSPVLNGEENIFFANVLEKVQTKGRFLIQFCVKETLNQ